MSSGHDPPPNMTVEMFETLKTHILRQKEKRKQEQEQDAAMERHRREQELKRKRDALSLEEIRDQLVHLEKRLKSLKDEKNDLFMQLKRVLNEDEKRKKQREAELMAKQQALMATAQQQNQQLSAQQSMPPHHSFSGYPYVDARSYARSLMSAVRPTATHPSHPDPFHLRLPVTTAPSSHYPTSSSSSNMSSNMSSNIITGNGGPPPTNKNTASVKRRHEGSPSPTPPPRPSSSSSKATMPGSLPPQPKTTTGYHFFYGAGGPFFYGAGGPGQMAYDAKGNPYHLPMPEGSALISREINDYEARLRGLSSGGLIPGNKGPPTGFPSQRPSSGIPTRSSPLNIPSNNKGDAKESRPPSGPPPPQSYRYFNK